MHQNVLHQEPSKEVLSQVRSLWQIEDSPFDFIRGNENWVYSVPDKNLIVRLTDKVHRSFDEICSEIHWLEFLQDFDLSISYPLKSIHDKKVEALSSQWTCVVFEKAPGSHLKEGVQFTPEVFSSWGRFLGKLHLATRTYRPLENKRNSWAQDDSFKLMLEGKNSLPPSDPLVLLFHEKIETMKSLETTSECFGLIHADFHHGNFFYDEMNQQITLFDFDDCQYHWFSFDLAIPFSGLAFASEMNSFEIDLQQCFQLFINSYLKEHSLSEEWIKKIPFFDQYRNLSLYFWALGREKSLRNSDSPHYQQFKDICKRRALNSTTIRID